jgi:hypothetical protein
MLEAELNCTKVSPASGGAWSRPLTAPLFIFDSLHPDADPRDVGSRNSASFEDALAYSSPPRREPRTWAGPPATPRTPLSPGERRALVALNALGADLGDELSIGALRRAFRRLARRYHPDRHPGSSVAERERLSRAFVEATEHYRVLSAAISGRS